VLIWGATDWFSIVLALLVKIVWNGRLKRAARSVFRAKSPQASAVRLALGGTLHGCQLDVLGSFLLPVTR
jgi:hypothetical protein